MNVFEVTKPGMSLKRDDLEWAHKVGILLDALILRFFEANVALNLFDSAQEEVRRNFVEVTREVWEARRRQISEIVVNLEETRGEPKDNAERLQLQFDAEAELARATWAEGALPCEFEKALLFVHARSFISAVDGFRKILDLLSNHSGVPSETKRMKARLKELFPVLKEVRDSLAHPEQRMEGKARGKVIPSKPVDSKLIKSSSAVGVMDNLNGAKYGTVIETGDYVETDVSGDSMVALQKVLQGTLDSFDWNGPRVILPGAGVVKR